MANKFDGDVRPLSNDPVYMGVVFTGSMKNAIKQAKAAPQFMLPDQPGRPMHISRDRWNLLEHLGLSRHYMVTPFGDPMVRKPPKRAAAPKPKLSPYSLEYAMQRWPENFTRGAP